MHMDVLSGTDFFTVEVLPLRGLVTYYVLFFIHLESRRIEVAGITPHPNESWMKQIARNVTMDQWEISAVGSRSTSRILIGPIGIHVALIEELCHCCRC